ncbi:hypothetical protein [Flagellimonas sp.]|uniref:hypothetical protein n=1 Tax=Flagellimonas sp. TaxID=2058762 RepID=UPI003B504CBD
MVRKSRLEMEYELRLTKKILERIIEMNKDKDLSTPDEQEMDKIQEDLKNELEREYPTYKIQKK